MPVSKMEKLTIIVQHQRVDALLERLMRLRCVDLIDMPCEPNKLSSYGEHANVAAAMAEAERIDAVLPSLYAHTQHKRRFFRALPKVKHVDFRIDGRMERANTVVDDAERIIAEKQALNDERDGKLAEMKTYTPYLGWEKPLDYDGDATTSLILGVFPAKTSRTNVVQTITDRAAMVRIISEDVKGLYVAIMVHRDEREATMRSLAKIGFMTVKLPRVRATAKTMFDQADKERAELEVKLARLERRLATLAEHVRDVEILSDIAHTKLLAEKQKHHLGSTANCAVLSAWCPVEEKERVTGVLERMEVAYEFEQPLTSDKPPMRLSNPRVIQPFERVLGTYAYPVYGKFEPTLILALMFCLAFGLMFPDAGYGLVMAVGAFLVMHFCRIPNFLKRFFFVMGCCGVFSVVFGVLLGSYFGPGVFFGNIAPLTFLPDGIIAVLEKFQPAKNPAVPVVLTLIIGTLHVAVGQVLGIIALFRQKMVKKALLDELPYLVFSLSVITVFFYWLAGVIALAASLLAILLTQGLQEKGFKGKMLGAAWGIVGMLRYIGMFFSYSRAFVLCAVSAVFGLVCFFLPQFAAFPFAMLLVMLLAFFGGYLSCKAINVLFGTARLNGLKYVDFAGKFYRDANPEFRPLAPEGRFAEDVSPVESNSF